MQKENSKNLLHGKNRYSNIDNATKRGGLMGKESVVIEDVTNTLMMDDENWENMDLGKVCSLDGHRMENGELCEACQ